MPRRPPFIIRIHVGTEPVDLTEDDIVGGIATTAGLKRLGNAVAAALGMELVAIRRRKPKKSGNPHAAPCL